MFIICMVLGNLRKGGVSGFPVGILQVHAIGLQEESLFPFWIPTLELNLLACLRREMGGKCLHPSPSISFASFISVNKSGSFIFFP